jgi:deoxyribodipyrimidine photo-lyase
MSTKVSDKRYKKTLFVFRRDLRLEDNLGLILALRHSEEVIPAFIYDSQLLKKIKNSELRWNFLNESLFDLDVNLKKKGSSLQVYEGDPVKAVEKIISEYRIDSVFSNIDFSNYSKTRDLKIKKLCEKNNIDVNYSLDFMLHDPNEIKTNEGKPYSVYSHFFKKAKEFPVRKILKNDYDNYVKNARGKNENNFSIKDNSVLAGGRNAGLKIIKNLKEFKDYEKYRDYPALDFTTKLSPHNKFGTISIRETLQKIVKELGPTHILINQIYWREFFNYILYHFPYSKTKSFKSKYEKLPWSKSQELFGYWCNGMTGFPIVDAGMRELNATGFMHNRVRMVVASFLTKDLHIDWRWGEKFFSEKLIDYDPAVNAGNWQWAASTGCDAVPYFRIFNPWRQQERFDCDCEYIKKWVPELEELSSKQIHNLWKSDSQIDSYPKPIVDHKIESDKSKKIFKSI